MWPRGDRNRASLDSGRCCFDLHQARPLCPSPHWINSLWAPAVSTESGLNGVGRPWDLGRSPIAPNWIVFFGALSPTAGTLPRTSQPAPSVIHVHSSTYHMDTSTNCLPSSSTPGINGDSRVLTQVLFSSLSRGLWNHPTSWLPPRIPHENVQWPFAFAFL